MRPVVRRQCEAGYLIIEAQQVVRGLVHFVRYAAIVFDFDNLAIVWLFARATVNFCEFGQLFGKIQIVRVENACLGVYQHPLHG